MINLIKKMFQIKQKEKTNNVNTTMLTINELTPVKLDRFTFEYNVQKNTLIEITMLFNDFLKTKKWNNNLFYTIINCINLVKKDLDFINKRLNEGSYNKKVSSDYNEELVTMLMTLKTFRTVRKTLFYYYDNKTKTNGEKFVVGKLIEILNNKINNTQNKLNNVKNVIK